MSEKSQGFVRDHATVEFADSDGVCVVARAGFEPQAEVRPMRPAEPSSSSSSS